MDRLMDLLRTLGTGQELSPLTALSTELGSAHGHRDSTGATCGPGRHGHPRTVTVLGQTPATIWSSLVL